MDCASPLALSSGDALPLPPTGYPVWRWNGLDGWLNARLEMGHYTNASRGPQKMNPGSLRPFQQARAKLQLLDKHEVTK